MYRPDRDPSGAYEIEWKDDVPVLKLEGTDAEARESLAYIRRYNHKVEQLAQLGQRTKRGKTEDVLIAEPGQLGMEGMG